MKLVDQMNALAQAGIDSQISRYRDAARACERGLKRMRWKLVLRDRRVAHLEDFIARHQLSGALRAEDDRFNTGSKARWEREKAIKAAKQTREARDVPTSAN